MIQCLILELLIRQHQHKLLTHLVPNKAFEGKLVTQSVHPPVLQILGELLAYFELIILV